MNISMTNSPQHILNTNLCTRPWLETLFTRVDEFQAQGYSKTLSDKIIATCFFEASTRTRLSFTAAAYKLGAHVLGFANGSATSVSKGETLEDTMRMVSSYADAIVLRHPEAGAAERAATVATVPIINGGDGTGQHPTQSILDLYTIHRILGRLNDLHIVMVGNLKYYRTTRSLAKLLANVSTNVTITLVSAPELKMLSDITDYLTARGVRFTETAELGPVLAKADVVYQTRMQQEWLSPDEFTRLKDQYILTRAHADTMKPGAMIMHALPRVNEIETAVDSSEPAKYFAQAAFGVPVRAALLEYVLGLWQ